MMEENPENPEKFNLYLVNGESHVLAKSMVDAISFWSKFQGDGTAEPEEPESITEIAYYTTVYIAGNQTP